MMKTKRFMCVIAAVFGVAGVALFESKAADVFLETKRSEFQKIPIWVMGFGDGNAGATDGGDGCSRAILTRARRSNRPDGGGGGRRRKAVV